MKEQMHTGAGCVVAGSQPWSAYQNWCEANKEKFVLAKTAFDERLKGLGCRQRKET